MVRIFFRDFRRKTIFFFDALVFFLDRLDELDLSDAFALGIQQPDERIVLRLVVLLWRLLGFFTISLRVTMSSSAFRPHGFFRLALLDHKAINR